MREVAVRSYSRQGKRRHSGFSGVRVAEANSKTQQSTQQPRKFPYATEFLVGTGLTVVIFSVAFACLRFYAFDELENLGAFVGGFGQLVAIVWIIITFRSQFADLSLQRRELEQQRKALEENAAYTHQGLSIELYKFQKRQLDRLTRSTLVCLSLEPNPLQDLDTVYFHGHDDAYIQCINQSDEIQTAIGKRLTEGDRLVLSYLEDYGERFRLLREALHRIDGTGEIHRALISESPAQEMHYFAKTAIQLYVERLSFDDADD